MARFHIYGVPEVGIELLADEQPFIAIAVEPYTRGDGGASFIIHWRANCADCGEPFDQTTGTAGNIPRRRCKDCRTPTVPRPVGQRGKAVNIEVRRPAPKELLE